MPICFKYFQTAIRTATYIGYFITFSITLTESKMVFYIKKHFKFQTTINCLKLV